MDGSRQPGIAGRLQTAALVGALKAAAEPTRLRILVLLSSGELNVKDLTQVLGQSQPRISRHLKLLNEAGLVDRFREGSWVYFHISDASEGGRLALQLIAAVDPNDPVLKRDRERAEALKRDRESAAQTYFHEHAADWDRIRALHVDESEVEAAMRSALGPGPFRVLIDLGTGTGRTLELFARDATRAGSASTPITLCSRSPEAIWRAPAIRQRTFATATSTTCRLGDGAADAVVMHQVLHFLIRAWTRDRRGSASLGARRTAADRRFCAARARVPARCPRSRASRLRGRLDPQMV